MPQKHEISVTWFDTCFSDYIADWSDIVVGIERSGQTRDELIEQVTDEVCSHEDFPLGDHAYGMLKAAVTEAIERVTVSTWRFWPVDENATEITDPDSDAYFEATQREQPSAWFRVRVTSVPLRIHLDNQGGDHVNDGSVLVTCDDVEAAKDDQSIDGSHWEAVGNGEAYTILTDRPSLVDELIADGYDVDQSCYCTPDERDIAYWSYRAECEEAGDTPLDRDAWDAAFVPPRCDECGETDPTVRHVENDKRNANVCDSCVPQQPLKGEP